jgi:hypothetical protein
MTIRKNFRVHVVAHALGGAKETLLIVIVPRRQQDGDHCLLPWNEIYQNVSSSQRAMEEDAQHTSALVGLLRAIGVLIFYVLPFLKKIIVSFRNLLKTVFAVRKSLVRWADIRIPRQCV